MKPSKLVQIGICGSAEQDSASLAKILGFAALYQKKHACANSLPAPEGSWRSYRSEVIISNSYIDYPKASYYDILVATSKGSYESCGAMIKPDSLVFLDTLFSKDVRASANNIYKLPAYESCIKETGSHIWANLTILACTVRLSRVVSLDSFNKSVRTNIHPEFLSQSLKALDLGLRLSKKIKP